MKSEEIRQALVAQFDQLSSSLDELRSRLRETKHEVRAQWESQLAELERQRRAARGRIEEFSSDSADAWKAFQLGIETTWRSLQQACEDAKRKFQ